MTVSDSDLHAADTAPLAFGGDKAGRPRLKSMLRGWRQRCPACGTGKLFRKYLKTDSHCPSCNEELFHHRADDAPPYFTIVVVGHVLLPLAGMTEKTWQPAMWIHMTLWPALALIMSLMLLPRIKGALVGLQWALQMHGFDGQGGDEPEPDPAPESRAVE